MTKQESSAAGQSLVGHAVTITGYRHSATTMNVPAPLHDLPSIAMRSASVEVVYVHDDNLGSHAHYELVDSAEVNEEGHEKLLLRRGRRNGPPLEGWSIDEWTIESALVPKPEKLRMPIESLFLDVIWFIALLGDIFPGVDLHYNPHFKSGIEYRRSLSSRGFAGDDLWQFQQELTLPRYIGVISVMMDDAPLVDVVLDVSEVPTHSDGPSVLAIVGTRISRLSPAGLDLRGVAKFFGCPLILLPA